MKLSIQIEGLSQVQSDLVGFSDRRLRASLATAMTRTVVQAKAEGQQAMQTAFDRPTDYTKNSLYAKPASADDLVAEVGFKDTATKGGRPAIKYLAPEILGGSRAMKGFERAIQRAGLIPAGYMMVPGAYADLDAFGNISRKQLAQILSHLRTNQGDGKSKVRNLADGSKGKRQQRDASGRYFVIKPGQRGPTPGVYLRPSFGGGREVLPVLIFVSRAAYRVRYDFERIVLDTVEQRLGENLGQGISDSASRLFARGT